MEAKTILIVIGLMTISFIAGHTTIGSAETVYIPVKYNIVENDAKCKKEGGNIEVTAVQLGNTERYGVRYSCVVPEKTIELK